MNSRNNLAFSLEFRKVFFILSISISNIFKKQFEKFIFFSFSFSIELKRAFNPSKISLYSLSLTLSQNDLYIFFKFSFKVELSL